MPLASAAPSARSGARDAVPTDNQPWLAALRLYLPFVIGANLLWEFAQLPLYTIWREAPAGEIVFAALHCTGGDALIATATLVLALLVAGGGWPAEPRAFRRVAALTVILGLGYTVFSEWLNIEVRGAWAYSELMPVVPIIGAGLSPLLQWIAIPVAGFCLARRAAWHRSTNPSAPRAASHPSEGSHDSLG